MAKYSLNNNRVIDCAILDENCIAGTYKVRFNNGIIRNVKKYRVHDLTRLDEGILDRIKTFGKNLLDKVISIGKYVYLAIGGKKISTLFNVMINAEEKKGMSFYPSKGFIKVCRDAGVEPTESIDDSGELQDAAMANAYWRKVMTQYSEGSGKAVRGANESYHNSSYAYRQRLRLFESDKIVLAQDKDGFLNVNTQELSTMLISQFISFLDYGAGGKNGIKADPYLIWGAPGIGKTQIINGIVNAFRKAGVDVSCIGVNARTMRRDDFALPFIDNDDVEVDTAFGPKTIKNRKAAEASKEWLPTYDPGDAKNGVTVEMLDDIANGGDGSGNGQGGFIFVDELSRVPGDVMEVFMGLTQDRAFGRRVLGSKWMFVFAANRLGDMGERGEDVHWESAYSGRFSHVNFVPTFGEWIAWAKRKNSRGEQNIAQEIIDFLQDNPECWYNSSLGNESEDSVVDSIYPNARAWENITKEIRTLLQGAHAANDSSKAGYRVLNDVYNLLGISKPQARMTAKDWSNAIRRHAGNKVANIFMSWYSFDNEFKSNDAARVWTEGDKAPMKFFVGPETISAAITKILTSKPDYNQTSVNVTPTEMLNIAKYIVAMADSANTGSTGSTRTNLIEQGWSSLITTLNKQPYNINLFDVRSASIKKYSAALRYINDEMGKTSAAVADAFGDNE